MANFYNNSEASAMDSSMLQIEQGQGNCPTELLTAAEILQHEAIQANPFLGDNLQLNANTQQIVMQNQQQTTSGHGGAVNQQLNMHTNILNLQQTVAQTREETRADLTKVTECITSKTQGAQNAVDKVLTVTCNVGKIAEKTEAQNQQLASAVNVVNTGIDGIKSGIDLTRQHVTGLGNQILTNANGINELKNTVKQTSEQIGNLGATEERRFGELGEQLTGHDGRIMTQCQDLRMQQASTNKEITEKILREVDEKLDAKFDSINTKFEQLMAMMAEQSKHSSEPATIHSICPKRGQEAVGNPVYTTPPQAQHVRTNAGAFGTTAMFGNAHVSSIFGNVSSNRHEAEAEAFHSEGAHNAGVSSFLDEQSRISEENSGSNSINSKTTQRNGATGNANVNSEYGCHINSNNVKKMHEQSPGIETMIEKLGECDYGKFGIRNCEVATKAEEDDYDAGLSRKGGEPIAEDIAPRTIKLCKEPKVWFDKMVGCMPVKFTDVERGSRIYELHKVTSVGERLGGGVVKEQTYDLVRGLFLKIKWDDVDHYKETDASLQQRFLEVFRSMGALDIIRATKPQNQTQDAYTVEWFQGSLGLILGLAPWVPGQAKMKTGENVEKHLVALEKPTVTKMDTTEDADKAYVRYEQEKAHRYQYYQKPTVRMFREEDKRQKLRDLCNRAKLQEVIDTMTAAESVMTATARWSMRMENNEDGAFDELLLEFEAQYQKKIDYSEEKKRLAAKRSFKRLNFDDSVSNIGQRIRGWITNVESKLNRCKAVGVEDINATMNIADLSKQSEYYSIIKQKLKEREPKFFTSMDMNSLHSADTVGSFLTLCDRYAQWQQDEVEEEAFGAENATTSHIGAFMETKERKGGGKNKAAPKKDDPQWKDGKCNSTFHSEEHHIAWEKSIREAEARGEKIMSGKCPTCDRHHKLKGCPNAAAKAAGFKNEKRNGAFRRCWQNLDGNMPLNSRKKPTDTELKQKNA